VRDEAIEHIIAAGSDEALALLRDNLPAHLAEKLEATTKLDLAASDTEVLRATLESFRERQAESDAETVADLVDAWRSGGLGVAGPEATLRALELGQVDELVITGSADALKPVQRLPDNSAPGPVTRLPRPRKAQPTRCSSSWRANWCSAPSRPTHEFDSYMIRCC
jgi:hypothetical protein